MMNSHQYKLDIQAKDGDGKKAVDYAIEYGMNWLSAMIALY